MFPLAKRAKTHPDIALPVRSVPTLNMQVVLGYLSPGSEIRVFGPCVAGRHQTRYRRVFCPDSPLHGGFITESINGLKLIEILGEDRDLVTD